jgi:hypothetical protein
MTAPARGRGWTDPFDEVPADASGTPWWPGVGWEHEAARRLEPQSDGLTASETGLADDAVDLCSLAEFGGVFVASPRNATSAT